MNSGAWVNTQILLCNSTTIPVACYSGVALETCLTGQMSKTVGIATNLLSVEQEMPVSLVVVVSRCRTTNVVILTPALFQVMTPGLSSTGVTHHVTNTTGILSWTKRVGGIGSTSITRSILIPSVCENPPSTLLNQINSTSGMKRSHW